MASLLANSADFDGSEVVLVDLDGDRLELIRTLAEKMAQARGLDIAVTATTDPRAALVDCDAVLSSFRPGRVRGPGARRRISARARPHRAGDAGSRRVLHGASRDHRAEGRMRGDGGICPNASIFNYTNPVNIVAEAVTHHSSVKIVSLCEGPIYFADESRRPPGSTRPSST